MSKIGSNGPSDSRARPTCGCGSTSAAGLQRPRWPPRLAEAGFSGPGPTAPGPQMSKIGSNGPSDSRARPTCGCHGLHRLHQCMHKYRASLCTWTEYASPGKRDQVLAGRHRATSRHLRSVRLPRNQPGGPRRCHTWPTAAALGPTAAVRERCYAWRQCARSAQGSPGRQPRRRGGRPRSASFERGSTAPFSCEAGLRCRGSGARLAPPGHCACLATMGLAFGVGGGAHERADRARLSASTGDGCGRTGRSGSAPARRCVAAGMEGARRPAACTDG